MDKIEGTLVSAAMEFDKAEVERSYREAWEATERVLRPAHPARFKVGTLSNTLVIRHFFQEVVPIWHRSNRCSGRLQTATRPSELRKECFIDLVSSPQLLEALSKLYYEQRRYSEALEVVTKVHSELMMVFSSEGAERLTQVEGIMKE